MWSAGQDFFRTGTTRSNNRFPNRKSADDVSCIAAPQVTEGTTTKHCDRRQVFWLTVHPVDRAFSALRPRPIGPVKPRKWQTAILVPVYSGGSAVDFHHLPLSPNQTDTADRDRCTCKKSRAP
jgi:hypothetical protein